MTRYDERNPKGSGQPSQDLKNEAKAKAMQAGEQTKQQAKSQLEKGRDTASDEVEKVAHAVKAAASDLNDQNREGLSRYVGEMADSMTSVAQSLRTKNVDELVHEVSDLARRNPTLFIAGSVAIGLGLARFAKASSRQSQGESWQSSKQWQPGDTNEQSSSQFESGRGADWANSYTEMDYSSADYSRGGELNSADESSDFGSQANQSLTGDRLPSDKDNPDKPLGGRRYE